MNTTHIKNRYWLLFALLIILAPSVGAEAWDDIKKKEFNQTFKVDANGQLRIENRYGNITITHWDKNEVAIQVIVESKARSESEAQKGLDRVSIELRQSGNTVYGLTSFKSQNGWNNSGDGNRINIDYHISMPAKFAANLSQKYGNINLPEKNEGEYTMEVKYGNIAAGSFTAPLRIDAGYSNIKLEDVKSLQLDVAYCGNVTINDGKEIKIDSKYSNLRMGNVSQLTIDKKYGNLQVQNVDRMAIEVKYSECSVEQIKDDLNCSLSYSTLTVKELSPTFSRVRAEARYGNLNLSISSKASFQVNAKDMKYGSIEMKGFNITTTAVEEKVNYNYRINNASGSGAINFEGNNYSNIRIKAL
ncbi:MAG: DUF4097 domain-containing protein [Tannerellaceae bacterium]|jgi:hypothetical protein|nr:DUF4097 domain-containing protein [Tannerellaceae bacterium]